MSKQNELADLADVLTVSSGDLTLTGDVTAVDATLSGGVYLGGTAAANYLDDYEEGTFTPSLGYNSGGTAPTLSTASGYYVKVGRLVTVNIFIGISSAGSGTHLYIDGLPFTTISTGYSGYGSASYTQNGFTLSGQYGFGLQIRHNNNKIDYYGLVSGGSKTTVDSGNVGTEIIVNATFLTNS